MTISGLNIPPNLKSVTICNVQIMLCTNYVYRTVNIPTTEEREEGGWGGGGTLHDVAVEKVRIAYKIIICRIFL